MSYNGNGATGGNVPTNSKAYTSGQSVTVLGNTGGLVRTGYTFAGWNTAPNGSGTAYGAGATFSMGAANVTPYAVWTAITQPPSPGRGIVTPSSPTPIVTGFSPASGPASGASSPWPNSSPRRASRCLQTSDPRQPRR